MAYYCKGKGGVCDVPCINEKCEHFSGAGATEMRVPSVADMIRSMSNERLAEAVDNLSLRILDPEFDLSELWCHPELHGRCTGSRADRILLCYAQERKNCILCWLNSPAEEMG